MKKKAKLLLFLLTGITACAGAFALAGCSNNKGDSSDIKDGDTPLTPAVCTHEKATHTDAKGATCTATGNKEYWYCSDCQKYFTDEACTVETTLASLTLEVDVNAHNYGTLIKGSPATCTTEGSVAHYHCTLCKHDFDEQHKLLETLVIDPLDHHMVSSNNAKPATCTEAGHESDMHCDREGCGHVVNGAVIDIDPNAHTFGEYVYDYAAKKYVRTCNNGAHTEEQPAGTADYPYLVKDETELAAAVALGGYVKLTANISADVEIAKDKTVTLDLNNFTLSNVAEHTILNHGKLNLVGGGKVYNGTHKKAALLNQGVATVDGVSLERTFAKDANGKATNSWYTIENNGEGLEGVEITLKNVTVLTDPADTFTSLVRNYYAKMTIESGNYTSSKIALKNDEKGDLTVTGGTFSAASGKQCLQNYGKAAISGGTFIGIMSTNAYGEFVGETIITAGTISVDQNIFYYENAAAYAAPVIKVANGITVNKPTFTIFGLDDKKTTSDGYSIAMTEGAENTEYTLSRPTLVANESELTEAVKNDGQIKLLNDIPSIANSVIIKKSVTLDLNGHKITSTAEKAAAIQATAGKITITNGSIISNNYIGLIVAPAAECELTDCNITAKAYALYANGKVTITNGTYTGDSMGLAIFKGGNVEATGITVTSKGYGAQVGNGAEANKGTLILHGGSISGGSSCGIIVYGHSTVTAEGTTISCSDNIGFMGNGTCVGDTVTLTDCTVSGKEVGLYFPQKESTLTISGGSYTGEMSGIEVRGGTVEIRDATLTSTSETFVTAPNGNGATITGAALAVSQHSTDGTISVTLSGCKLKGIYSLYERDMQNDTAREKISVTLGEGNTYSGYVYSENCDNIVDTADGNGNALSKEVA